MALVHSLLAICTVTATGRSATSPAVHFDSSEGCQAHDYEVHADRLRVSFSMVMTDTAGWQTIRNDKTWDYGDVHLMLHDGRLFFGLAGNQPDEQLFPESFKPNVAYDIILDYDKRGSVSLTVNGSLSQSLRYQKARCVCITPGHLGCEREGGGFTNKFQGTITNLQMFTEGVHSMRRRPEDRPFEDEFAGSAIFYVLISVAGILIACCALKLLLSLRTKWWQKAAAEGQAGDANAVVGRPLEVFSGPAVVGQALAVDDKKESSPYVEGLPVEPKGTPENEVSGSNNLNPASKGAA